MKKPFKKMLASAVIATRDSRVKPKGKTKTGVEKFADSLLRAPRLSTKQGRAFALRSC
jgi:hypothetical protein